VKNNMKIRPIEVEVNCNFICCLDRIDNFIINGKTYDGKLVRNKLEKILKGGK